MNTLLNQIEQYWLDKDPDTKKKILAIKNQLKEILDNDAYSTSSSTVMSPRKLKESQNTSDEVTALVEIVNNILMNTSDGNYCTIKQKVIVQELTKIMWTSNFEYTRLDAMERVFELNWWEVTYDSPSYWDSNFDAYFKFSAK